MKLYWRVKKDGKWTWRPADVYDRGCCEYIKVWPLPSTTHPDEGSRREHGNGDDPEPLE